MSVEPPTQRGVVDGTTPYPWPWDGDLRVERLALVVTGWDEHWRSAVLGNRGAAARSAVIAAEVNIGRLAAAVDIVLTVSHPAPPRRQRSRGSQSSRGAGPATCDLSAPEIPAMSVPGARAIAAAGIDGFYGGPLGPCLRRSGVELLLLAGLGLETTVHSTIRSANDAGLECLVVLDACVPLAPELVDRSVSMIEMSGGIFGAVGSTDAVLAALMSSGPAAPVPTPTPSPSAPNWRNPT